MTEIRNRFVAIHLGSKQDTKARAFANFAARASSYPNNGG